MKFRLKYQYVEIALHVHLKWNCKMTALQTEIDPKMKKILDVLVRSVRIALKRYLQSCGSQFFITTVPPLNLTKTQNRTKS